MIDKVVAKAELNEEKIVYTTVLGEKLRFRVYGRYDYDFNQFEIKYIEIEAGGKYVDITDIINEDIIREVQDELSAEVEEEYESQCEYDPSCLV